jgi:HNH endonuclease
MSDCILYTGYIDQTGYGVSQRNLKRDKAHRWAWIETFGEIPGGLCVLHKCDVRACINPEHLFLGTHADNIADMVSKNRQRGAKGETAGQAKLTESQVLEIRQSPNSCYALARQFGVWPTQISRIKRGVRWKHLNA